MTFAQKMDQYLDKYCELYKLSGIFRVTHKDEIIYQRCMGYADIDTLTPTTEYNDEKDYQMLKGHVNKVILNKGDFCVVFPEDAHLPQMIGDDGKWVKKAVVKMKV